MGLVDAVPFEIIKVVDDESCGGGKSRGQNQCKELGVEQYRPKEPMGARI
jgi:hypothetical protein